MITIFRAYEDMPYIILAKKVTILNLLGSGLFSFILFQASNLY